MINALIVSVSPIDPSGFIESFIQSEITPEPPPYSDHCAGYGNKKRNRFCPQGAHSQVRGDKRCLCMNESNPGKKR